MFRGLLAEQMDAIDSICIPRTLASGQWLFPKAEQARNIYPLEEGAIELLVPVEPDIEVPVALIRSCNDCVGIGALLEPYTYTLSARGKEPSRLIAIASGGPQALFKSDPAFGYAVMTNPA